MRKIQPWLSIWPALCVVVLGLILAGLGAYFAIRESRVAIGIRLESLRPRALRLSETVQSQFLEATTSALREADNAFRNNRPWPFEQTKEQYPWCTLFVLFDQGRYVTWPKPPAQIQPLPLEMGPQSFLLAEQVEFVDEDLDEAIRLYEYCDTANTSVPWQRRARMAIAACKLKQGKPGESLAIYDRLLADVTSLAAAAFAPTPYQIHLARIDALEALGRTDDARRDITRLANRVAAGNIPVESLDEADYMFDRLEQLTGRPDTQLRFSLAQLMETQAIHRRLDRLARLWLAGRLPFTAGPAQSSAVPVFYFNMTDEKEYGFVSLDVAQESSQPRIVLAALDPQIVEARLRNILSRQEGGMDLALRPAALSGRGSDSWVVPISPHLAPWEIRPAPEFVQAARNHAYLQTLTYLALTVLLVIALLLAVRLMVSTLRREMALAQLKSDFVANVSHELKTPLALIRLFGETLLAGRVTSKEKEYEYFRIITRESERLTHLINNILDFSSIEAGQKRYQLVPANVGPLVRETMETYNHELVHKGFAHSLDVDPDLPRVLLDPSALQQAIINLINNAIKYSPEEKWLAVSVKNSAENGRKNVSISISDHGCGIDQQGQARLFQPFYRVPGEGTAGVRGAGLGLSLVKHIIDAHGGRVEVHSQSGRGSTFCIVLPAVDSGYSSTQS